MLRRIALSDRYVRVAATAALCLAAACGTESGTTGQITVQLADASCADIQSATVWISQVYLIGGSDSGGPRYTITDQAQTYDLLTLQGGVTAALGTATIPTGSYTQMRLVVDSARIQLRAGLTFSSGATSAKLTVPSGAQTGIKVNFAGPLTVSPGQTILVVDFDICQSFVFTGPPALPTGVLFKPVLHATVRDIAGSISGTVSPVAARALVYAIVNGDTAAATAADTLTGTYTLRFLHPATYTVSASATGYQTASVNNVVVAEAQNVTGVNFTLVP